jgi:hypothetical protein
MLRKALIISLFKQESWGQHVPIYRCRPFGNHHKRKPPFSLRKRGVNIRRFDSEYSGVNPDSVPDQTLPPIPEQTRPLIPE